MKAVRSIPAYIEYSTLLLVLVPNVFRGQKLCSYATWRKRGWCRTEMVCAMLASNNIRIMICDGGKPALTDKLEAITLSPGLGNFACCANDHVVAGATVACD